MPTPNWPQVAQECADTLSRLIQFNTTNPPGNETEACQWLAQLLEQEGIEAQVIESAPGRGNVVARIKAGQSAGDPLLLLGHVDVVPAAKEEWRHDPFGGEQSEGQVWGRGALDMKGIVATWVTLVQQLKRQSVQLKRDVVLMVNADEEQGGVWGAKWMAEHHWDLYKSGAALNEGGGEPFRINGKLYYGYQVGEKYACRFKLVAKGRPGHGSIPKQDNAVVHLAKAVAALGTTRLPVHITPTVRGYLEAVAATQDEPVRSHLLRVLDPASSYAAIDDAFPDSPGEANRLRALVANGASPTMLQAGNKINVIPSTAECSVDYRVLPGISPAEAKAEIVAVLQASGLADKVEVVMTEGRGHEASPVEHPLVDCMRKALAKHSPKAALVPIMATGATDGRWIRPNGTVCYGFVPLLEDCDDSGVHGIDEHISVASLGFSLQVMWDVILDYCAR